MIFTTDNNDTPTIHVAAITCQGCSMSCTDNYKRYHGDGIDDVL